MDRAHTKSGKSNGAAVNLRIPSITYCGTRCTRSDLSVARFAAARFPAAPLRYTAESSATTRATTAGGEETINTQSENETRKESEQRRTLDTGFSVIKNKAEAIDTRNKRSIFTSAPETSGRSFKQMF
jgi:hypothetical protein